MVGAVSASLGAMAASGRSSSRVGTTGTPPNGPHGRGARVLAAFRAGDAPSRRPTWYQRGSRTSVLRQSHRVLRLRGHCSRQLSWVAVIPDEHPGYGRWLPPAIPALVRLHLGHAPLRAPSPTSVCSATDDARLAWQGRGLLGCALAVTRPRYPNHGPLVLARGRQRHGNSHDAVAVLGAVRPHAELGHRFGVVHMLQRFGGVVAGAVGLGSVRLQTGQSARGSGFDNGFRPALLVSAGASVLGLLSCHLGADPGQGSRLDRAGGKTGKDTAGAPAA